MYISANIRTSLCCNIIPPYCIYIFKSHVNGPLSCSVPIDPSDSDLSIPSTTRKLGVWRSQRQPAKHRYVLCSIPSTTRTSLCFNIIPPYCIYILKSHVNGPLSRSVPIDPSDSDLSIPSTTRKLGVWKSQRQPEKHRYVLCSIPSFTTRKWCV